MTGQVFVREKDERIYFHGQWFSQFTNSGFTGCIERESDGPIADMDVEAVDDLVNEIMVAVRRESQIGFEHKGYVVSEMGYDIVIEIR